MTAQNPQKLPTRLVSTDFRDPGKKPSFICFGRKVVWGPDLARANLRSRSLEFRAYRVINKLQTLNTKP